MISFNILLGVKEVTQIKCFDLTGPIYSSLLNHSPFSKSLLHLSFTEDKIDSSIAWELLFT